MRRLETGRVEVSYRLLSNTSNSTSQIQVPAIGAMSLCVASAPQLCARPSAPLRRKGRLCLRSGRRAVRVSALFGAKPVAVPLNLYAALGVPPRAPAGVVDVAAAERAAQPPGGAAELSPAALRARGELLALAGRTLASPARRAAYETALASAAADVEVPLGALPGALLLLQARPLLCARRYS